MSRICRDSSARCIAVFALRLEVGGTRGESAALGLRVVGDTVAARDGPREVLSSEAGRDATAEVVSAAETGGTSEDSRDRVSGTAASIMKGSGLFAGSISSPRAAPLSSDSITSSLPWVRRRQKMKARKARKTAAIPPTTPPTIGPTELWDRLVPPVPEVVVGVAVDEDDVVEVVEWSGS